nr:MAG TPA: Protein of unknown function (DUF4046) [Caudoviricetes sp.]DAL97949.1 MAG TPA: Protein of unknown function (DUF4046) [Caudoviricetes sp.]
MTGPEFPKGFWTRQGTACICDQDRRHAVGNLLPYIEPVHGTSSRVRLL